MMPAQATQAGQARHEIVCATLKRNSIQRVTHVPGNVFKPPIKAVHERNRNWIPLTRE
jgi:hypothetical protein